VRTDFCQSLLAKLVLSQALSGGAKIRPDPRGTGRNDHLARLISSLTLFVVGLLWTPKILRFVGWKLMRESFIQVQILCQCHEKWTLVVRSTRWTAWSPR